MWYWYYAFIICFTSIGIYDVLKYIHKWVKSIVDEYKKLNEIDDTIAGDDDEIISVLPDNAEGVMTDDLIEVNKYIDYIKSKKGN